jgi:SAM-dependent methyltransferase
VIFKATPQEVVDRMLVLARLKPSDVLYDLGCGDGRIVITAAKRYGVKAVGVEIDPKRVAESRENARKAGVDHLVTIIEQDLFKTDLTSASVVTLYLLPTLNVRLMPQLSRMKPGSRVLSHSFAMKGAKPSAIERVHTPDGAVRTVFLWVVPWKSDGSPPSHG